MAIVTNPKVTGHKNEYVFDILAADPTGVTAGYIYYNTTANKLKLKTAAGWETITSA